MTHPVRLPSHIQRTGDTRVSCIYISGRMGDEDNSDYLARLHRMKRQKTGEEKEAFTVTKQEVDLSSGGDEVWLAKVPRELMDAWASADHNAVLGSVSFAPSDSGGELVFDVSAQALSMESPLSSAQGLSYRARPGGVVRNPLNVFSEETLAAAIHGQARKRRLEAQGLVTSRMTLTPVDNKAYDTLVKHRSTEAAKKTAFVLPADALTEGRAYKDTPVSAAEAKALREDAQAVAEAAARAKVAAGFASSAPPPSTSSYSSSSSGFGFGSGPQAPRELRVSMPMPQLENLVVSLLEKKRYMTRREIQEVVKQPDNRLRAVLDKFTVRHTSGELQHQYELKPEFSTHNNK